MLYPTSDLLKRPWAPLTVPTLGAAAGCQGEVGWLGDLLLKCNRSWCYIWSGTAPLLAPTGPTTQSSGSRRSFQTCSFFVAWLHSDPARCHTVAISEHGHGKLALGQGGRCSHSRSRQYYTLLEQKAIILIFISIIDINVNLSKNEIDKKINLSWLKYQSTPLYIVAYVCT